MKVSINWLKQLVAVDLSANDIAHKLTMAGLEVEESAPVAADFSGVVVAEVQSVRPHPNADKLRVTEVDAGTGTLLQIVCGAPNVVAGMRVPCALIGAALPGIAIKKAVLRGVESNGMLCSARELGLSDDHGGLLALPADAPIGTDIRRYLDLDDTILTLKITPNRGDCMSMFGIARELAALTGAPLQLPTRQAVEANGDLSRSVKISAPQGCGHYLGRVISRIDPGAPTPAWMRTRLERAGFRSISALVDITNYLTLERGRPMHAFDQDKLQGGLDVRYARAGEEMNLLTGEHVSLDADMLLITDDSGPIAIGGVMGGLESSVTPSTTSVFFEAAYFDPDTVRGKARQLGIHSDAAHRFERGVDPASAREGIEYATALTVAICGTPDTAIGPISEALGELPKRHSIPMRPERAVRLIGVPISREEMVNTLHRLGCTVSEEAAGLAVTPPSYRFDLRIEEDIAEEVIRVHGYEEIPARPPVSSVPILSISESSRSRAELRRTLAAHGFSEVINYAFIDAAHEAGLHGNSHPIALANPIAAQMSVMRSSLIAGLLTTLRHNIDRGEARAQLFEIGRCFLADMPTVTAQPERLAALAYGLRYPEQWGEAKGERPDFYSLKGSLELLFPTSDLQFEAASHPALHPGRTAKVTADGIVIGWIGELHPKWQQALELPVPPVVFEIELAAVQVRSVPLHHPQSRMQAVRRDVAFVVSESISVAAIQQAFWEGNPAYAVDFCLFDVYRGPHVGDRQKSLAFRIVMQDTERTLTDVECDTVVANFVKVMSQKFNATLRK